MLFISLMQAGFLFKIKNTLNSGQSENASNHKQIIELCKNKKKILIIVLSHFKNTKRNHLKNKYIFCSAYIAGGMLATKCVWECDFIVKSGFISFMCAINGTQ